MDGEFGFDMDGIDLGQLEGNFDGLPDRHWNLEVDAEMTVKGVAKCLTKLLERMNERQLTVFRAGAFCHFVDVPPPDGDALLMHAMMLHEVRGDNNLVALKRFRFQVEGHWLEYGEPEFILITGLKTGQYLNLLADKSHRTRSTFRARVFPDQTDQGLRLQHVADLINNERFFRISAEDAALVSQIYLLLRGFMGRDMCTGIPPSVLTLADDPNRWNRYER